MIVNAVWLHEIGFEIISKKRFSIRSLLFAVALVAVLLSVTVPVYRWLNQDRFVITVTNEQAVDLRDVKISGLGQKGEIGLLRPQETKFLVVDDSMFRKNCQLSWIKPSGIETWMGRPDDWNAGSNANGKIFEVSVKDAAYSFGWTNLTVIKRFKYQH